MLASLTVANIPAVASAYAVVVVLGIHAVSAAAADHAFTVLLVAVAFLEFLMLSAFLQLLAASVVVVVDVRRVPGVSTVSAVGVVPAPLLLGYVVKYSNKKGEDYRTTTISLVNFMISDYRDMTVFNIEPVLPTKRVERL